MRLRLRHHHDAEEEHFAAERANYFAAGFDAHPAFPRLRSSRPHCSSAVVDDGGAGVDECRRSAD